MTDDQRAILFGVIGAAMFFAFMWGTFFACVAIGFGPEVCGG